MSLRVLVPTESKVLTFNSPLTFPLLVQLACSSQLAYPTHGDSKWFETQHPLEYDNTPQFWSPYLVTPSGVCIKPWALSGRKYVSRALSGGTTIEQLDPAEWRVNLANLLDDVQYMSPEIFRACGMMRHQYVEPEGDLLMMREALDMRVRQSMATGSLVYDLSKSRAMIAAMAKYLNGAP